MYSEIIRELMEKKAKYYVFDGRPHFKVQDVKELMPDVKINPDMIIEKSDGERLFLVNEDALSPMTEFDKKIAQSLNFNPNKK